MINPLARFFSRRCPVPGWLALRFVPEGMDYVHLRQVPGGRPQVTLAGTAGLDAGDEDALGKFGRELGVGRYACLHLLGSGEYQLLQVEALNVPDEEMKTALRWRIKDMLDYPVDEATVDMLDMTVGGGTGRARFVYGVAARNEVIRRRMALFAEAGVPLSVIDIRETSQRNIAALLEEKDRCLALLSFDGGGGLLTINYKGVLHLSRHIEVPLSQLQEKDEGRRQPAFERVALEVQRSLDHFDRQFHLAPLNKLTLAPLPEISGLSEYLAAHLYMPAEPVDLATVLDISAVPDLAQPVFQSRYFLLLGAALRPEGGAG